MSSTNDSYAQMMEYYRGVMEGHVHIRETIDTLLVAVERRARELGRPPSILELGCHAGVSTEWLLDRCPEAELIVCDEREEVVAATRQRLAGRRVQYHTGPLQTWQRPVDFVVSIARHHHLPADYLTEVRRMLRPEGMYFLADEICPEYCHGEDAARISNAEIIHIHRGYVLTSREDVSAFEERGLLPEPVRELEELRQIALWRWYRYVVDEAIERGYVDIAVSELQSTHDDLITGSEAEHKFGPLIVERQLALAGFSQLSKRSIGPADPERQSMFVYEFELSSRAR